MSLAEATASAATPEAAAAIWADALTALQLLARQPQGLGGIWLRAPHGPVREAWLQTLAQQPLPVLRAPGSVDTARWLGGLDLAATLQTGRVHEQPGLLRQADGGLLCLPMAERFAPALTATLAQTLDRGGVDTGGTFQASRFGVVALDESLDDEAPLAPALQERLGLWIDLRELPPAAVRNTAQTQTSSDERAPVVAGDSTLQALCGTALALGIGSLRVPQLALSVACAHAELHRRDHVADEDLAYACRTVLAPRARQWPADASAPQEAQDSAQAETEAPPPESPSEPPSHPSSETAPPEPPPDSSADTAQQPPTAPPEVDPEALQAMMVAAAAARLPPDLLQRLMTGAATGRSGSLTLKLKVAPATKRGQDVDKVLASFSHRMRHKLLHGFLHTLNSPCPHERGIMEQAVHKALSANTRESGRGQRSLVPSEGEGSA